MSRSPDELDALVDGVRARSEEAFSAVYRLTASGLASFAHSMLRDRTAAEDAVQQAFLELTRAAPGIKGSGRSLRAWLYRSVRFSCLDELRRRRRRPEHLTADLPDARWTGEPQLPDPDLQQALGELGDRDRSLVVLKHVAGLPADEVGKVLGMNRPAVYAATARAERRLRKGLEGAEASATTSRPTSGGTP